MRSINDRFSRKLAAQARIVAAALIAPFKRGASVEEIDVWLARMPTGRRRTVVGATLGLLFLAAMAAAQFGVIGLCLFFLGVILLVR